MGKRVTWTIRRLRAALAAVNAMLAGAEGEGDWPEDVAKDDLEAARDRLYADLKRAEERKAGSNG